MKKIIIIGIFLLFPFVLFGQWDDCSFGETNGSCEAPGNCGRYTDSNSDQICDHSQEDPIKNITIQKDANISSARDIAINTDIQNKSKNQYPLFVIVVVVSLFYGVTYILAQKKTITMIMHKKIWNSVLMMSFLATSILGIILIIRINYGFIFAIPFNVMYWHVVTGVVMMIASFFHIGWHWKYYKNLFKR